VTVALPFEAEASERLLIVFDSKLSKNPYPDAQGAPA